MDWETIATDKGSDTQRTRVPGGYLYRTVVSNIDYGISVAMTFVPFASYDTGPG